jgi:hypothetical protein
MPIHIMWMMANFFLAAPQKNVPLVPKYCISLEHYVYIYVLL